MPATPSGLTPWHPCSLIECSFGLFAASAARPSSVTFSHMARSTSRRSGPNRATTASVTRRGGQPSSFDASIDSSCNSWDFGRDVPRLPSDDPDYE